MAKAEQPTDGSRDPPRGLLRPKRRWLTLGSVAALFLVLSIWDAGRAPASQASARLLLTLIHGYRATLSPVMPKLGVTCRFEPTCSVYGEAAVRAYGGYRGLWMAARRISRCGPWTETGTVDPLP